MLLLRTASGGFIRAESIVGLWPHRDGDGQITWAAVRADGSQVELAGYYGTPGRIEKALPHLVSAPRQSHMRSRGQQRRKSQPAASSATGGG